MGLDMYAFSTSENIDDVDFDQPKDARNLFYWRKHPDLHGWMAALYREKGGQDPDFNLSPLRLDSDDLDALERAVNNDNLPHTVGFFFGESRPEDKLRTLVFIACAREVIRLGKRVFYHAWW